MHILLITDNFPPETNAPATRSFEHSKRWVRAGCEVTVITGCPNFPRGEVFHGYRNSLFSYEVIDGIQVLRVWSYIAPNAGVYRRTLDYLSFCITSCIASLFVRKVDVIIGTSPQIFVAFSASLASSIKGTKWIFEVRDLWPESIIAVTKLTKSLGMRVLSGLVDHLYCQADGIIVVTSSFQEYVLTKGVSAENICVVPNGANLEEFDLEHLRNHGHGVVYSSSKKFIVGYLGTIGLAHDLRVVIDAAKILVQKNVKNISFVIVGDGAEKDRLVDMVMENNLGSIVFFKDAVPRKEIASCLRSFDVGLVHLKDEPLFDTVVPSKIFELMASGTPILAGLRGEAKELVKNLKVGSTFAPGDAWELVGLIDRYRDNLALVMEQKKNGIQAARQFNRDELSIRALNFIKQTVT